MNITKKNAQAAYDKGCDDVRDVLTALFPDMDFQPQLKHKKGDRVFIKLEVRVSGVDAEDDEGTYNLMSDELDLDDWVSAEELDEMIIS